MPRNTPTSVTDSIDVTTLNRGDLVSCDECSTRFRVLDLGHKLSAIGTGRVVEHYDSRTGEACDVSFYCSGDCADVNAPPGIALAADADTETDASA